MNEQAPLRSSAPPAQAHSGGAISGWVEAGLYVLTIATLSIVETFAIGLGAHVIVLILYSLLISSAGMLAVTGPGSEPIRVMLHPMSWLVGLGIILVETGFCLVLITISPAEGNLLLRVSIPLALVIGAVVFGRNPGTGAWLGAAIVLAGVIGTLGVTLDVSAQGIGVLYGVIAAIGICLRGFAGEFHPWNRAARNVAEKMRVTALVVLVTGLTGLLLVALIASLVGSGLLDRNDLLPAPADLWHGPTLVMALLVGGVIFAAMNYLQFSSVVKIQTENFVATSAFMPLAAWLLQSVAVSLGIIDAVVFDWRLLPGILVVVVGVMVLITFRRR